MSDRILNVKNLYIDIPVAGGMLHAVDGISLHVNRGETLCIVGSRLWKIPDFARNYEPAAT